LPQASLREAAPPPRQPLPPVIEAAALSAPPVLETAAVAEPAVAPPAPAPDPLEALLVLTEEERIALFT
jgi:hypothetical protein